ncbi:C40 family peptidase [Aneurinibacillus sp. BA2021]|nr:C40 family peptidase [Aneurinibacillus sp. BA2021]
MGTGWVYAFYSPNQASQQSEAGVTAPQKNNALTHDTKPAKAVQTKDTSVADAIIAMGKTYMGTPYVYGAERFQDKTFDCSSFVQYLYDKQGISLGWNAREQAVQGTDVPVDQLEKGDLLFFADEDFPNETGLNKVRHVGIYMGNGKILHTYEEGIGVTISDLHNDAREGNYWSDYFLFAKRVIQ